MCDVSESASGCVDGRSRRDDGDIVTHLVYEERHQSSSDDGVADHDIPVGCVSKDATGIWSASDDDDDSDDDGDGDDDIERGNQTIDRLTPCSLRPIQRVEIETRIQVGENSRRILGTKVVCQ